MTPSLQDLNLEARQLAIDWVIENSINMVKPFVLIGQTVESAYLMRMGYFISGKLLDKYWKDLFCEHYTNITDGRKMHVGHATDGNKVFLKFNSISGTHLRDLTVILDVRSIRRELKINDIIG